MTQARQGLVRLCRLLIRQHLGEVVERVAGPLLVHGRLSLPEIVQMRVQKGEDGDEGEVYQALFVLIQANLLWHTYNRQSEGGGGGGGGGMTVGDHELELENTVYFEIRIDHVLHYLAWPRILEIVRNCKEKQQSRERAHVVEYLLMAGKAQGSHLVEHLSQEHGEPRTIYQEALASLMEEQWVRLALPSEHLSPTDLRLELEQNALSSMGEVAPSAKKLAMAHQAARARVTEMEEDEYEESLIGLENNKRKRQRGSKGEEDGHDEEEEISWICLNIERLNVLYRNELVVKAVGDRYNDACSRIVDAMFQHTLHTQRLCKQDSTPGVSVDEIWATLSHDCHAVSCLEEGLSSISSGVHPLKGPERVLEYMRVMNREDDLIMAAKTASSTSFYKTTQYRVVDKMTVIEKPEVETLEPKRKRRKRIEQDDDGEVKIRQKNGKDLWTVNLDQVCRRLKKRVLDQLISSLYGPAALRIVNLLLDKNKLDEKAITNYAMLPSKDVRILVSSLARDNILSLQEVPKSNDRVPARTIFLWYTELASCFAQIETILYKMMANSLARQESEDEKNQALLLKLNRTDVKESGDKLLTTVEIKAKQKYLNRKEMVEVEIQRLERILFIVTSLPG